MLDDVSMHARMTLPSIQNDETLKRRADLTRNIPRRTFLRTCADTAGAAGGLAYLSRVASAIEPIVRNGSHKFKFSLAAYSYRDLLRGDPPELTLADFIDDCAKMNLEGTELTSYYFPADLTDDYLRQLKQHCFRLGLDISGTAVGNDFGFPPGEDRSDQIAQVKKWIDHAEILGVSVIRIFAGKPKASQSASQTYALMVEGIEECCDYAGQHGVYLALENHGGPTATATGILAFVRDVNSPWFGVNFDSGNFYSTDPYLELRKLHPTR